MLGEHGKLTQASQKWFELDDCIFSQNTTFSQNSILVLYFLKEIKSYVGVKESPPFSPYKNPLDHHICNNVKDKVYKVWLTNLFPR